ncbi:uncharacterized protein FOMMEDRAFT_16011 [Fomitiporia mediterranea MF3/22]|uniref:uncharacterized protein n=1 Tax=Fomitiporia mediterranea (strain MF3/22) TaxID=694068 RepID=UPI0004409052|nr:uncharacterized protein FOMMEDRAFT_16011 [Fomitiporia mediterranea MF3/22]EJD07312.1 hypothetical protein FOMMEDRAFT_16011 [Fomitiporia mediterranea MF3/22]
MSDPTSVQTNMRNATIPPLKGDGSGVYRVHIVGNSGAGKSTLADELGAMLNLPVIHFDRLFWLPGWRESQNDEFNAKVTAALSSEACPRGWVVDGNYNKRLRGQMDCATDIIWLDTPFLLYFPRLLKRTFLRLFRITDSCAPGCDERFSEVFFSRDSIIWWSITNHIPVKRRCAERLRVEGVHMGGRMRRIGGWGAELEEWKRDVRELIKGK